VHDALNCVVGHVERSRHVSHAVSLLLPLKVSLLYSYHLSSRAALPKSCSPPCCVRLLRHVFLASMGQSDLCLEAANAHACTKLRHARPWYATSSHMQMPRLPIKTTLRMRPGNERWAFVNCTAVPTADPPAFVACCLAHRWQGNL
jgi:hypothetical protein